VTFEDLNTILSEIEVCLNSRPMCPLTSNVEDLRVLTLSHFLLRTTSDIVQEVERQASMIG
jgi:hypothetical protein